MEADQGEARRVLEAREAAIHSLREELSYVHGVHDDAWHFSYTDGLERMKT